MIFNRLLQISNDTFGVYQFRNRSTYYKQPNGLTPRFIRRFFLRYPKAILYITTGLLLSSFIAPMSFWIFKYNTMSSEEFRSYRENYNSDVMKRQCYGIGLWYPWKSDKNE